jgi:hypothetical protein
MHLESESIINFDTAKEDAFQKNRERQVSRDSQGTKEAAGNSLFFSWKKKSFFLGYFSTVNCCFS